MTEIAAIATSFADARRNRLGFAGYPGRLPDSLGAAYAVQEAAIAQWQQPIAGWKVGRITGEAEKIYGENRFLGPIFAETISIVERGQEALFPVIPGGCAALEAELIARVDVPSGDGPFSARDSQTMVREWYIGIEVAGSPCAALGDLGPLASIAGFGNNLGLIVGPQIAVADPAHVQCSVTIDDAVLADGHAGSLPGGPLEAVAFALNKLRALGHPPSSGLLISTGALTGVHPVRVGQLCHARFAPGGSMKCQVAAIS